MLIATLKSESLYRGGLKQSITCCAHHYPYRRLKLAALAQVGERDAAMAIGRPHGGASDGAVLGGHQCITCELASPSQPSSHAPTPLTFPRDGVGA